MVNYSPSVFNLLASRYQTDDGHARQRMSVERVLKTQDVATRAIRDAFIDLRRETGISYKVGAPKEFARAQDKASTDYDNDLSLVCDWARGKIVVDSPEQVQRIQAIFADPQSDFMQKHGMFVVQENDCFANLKQPTGYSCLNYKIAVKVGVDETGEDEYQICEMQVVAEQIEAVSKMSHGYKRDAEDIAARGVTSKLDLQLMSASYAASRLINARARREGGYEALLENPARDGLTRHREMRIEDRVHALELVKARLVRDDGAVFKGNPKGVIDLDVFDIDSVRAHDPEGNEMA